MQSLVGVLRGLVGFALGMIAGMVVLAIGRQLAFGSGLAPTPGDLSLAAQVGVAMAWFLGAVVAVWIALRVSQRRLAGLVATAWLFQMAWLSPGVRPLAFEMRAVVALLVAVGGVGVYLMWQARQEPVRQLSDYRQAS